MGLKGDPMSLDNTIMFLYILIKADDKEAIKR